MSYEKLGKKVEKMIAKQTTLEKDLLLHFIEPNWDKYIVPLEPGLVNFAYDPLGTEKLTFVCYFCAKWIINRSGHHQFWL